LKRYTVQIFRGFGLSLTKEYAKEKTITENVTIRKFKKIKEKERKSQGHNLVFE
jgi:hypothetical protein